MAGRKELAEKYRAKAARLKELVETKLWDPEAKFFKTLQRSRHELVTPKNSLDGSVPKLHWMDKDHRGTLEWRALDEGTNHAPEGRISKSYTIRMGRNNSEQALNDGEGAGKEAGLVDVREQHGFTPWHFNLPERGRGYEVAWKQLMDPKGFLAPFGPTTAEQRHPEFKISCEGHGCQWNGPSWPLSTSVTLTALANVLNNYEQDAIDKAAGVREAQTKAHLAHDNTGLVCTYDLGPLR